jgi:hypothetical protein
VNRTIEDILRQSDTFTEEGEKHLDELYLAILRSMYEQKGDKLMDRRRAILGLLAVARDPLSATSIASILGISQIKLVTTCLNGLHSLLVIPKDAWQPIHFHHGSFPDFLTNQDRCTDPRFYIDINEHHFVVMQGCFSIMNKQLKRNICGLNRYSQNDSLSSIKRDECIDESLRYSCRYWDQHLLSDLHRDERMEATTARMLDDWLNVKLLQWFEVLALLQDLGRAVAALNNVQEWLSLVRMSHWNFNEDY